MKQYRIGQNPDYTDWDKISNILDNVPVTYLPALLIKIAERSLRMKVWSKNGLVDTIIRIQERFDKNE